MAAQECPFAGNDGVGGHAGKGQCEVCSQLLLDLGLFLRLLHEGLYHWFLNWLQMFSRHKVRSQQSWRSKFARWNIFGLISNWSVCNSDTCKPFCGATAGKILFTGGLLSMHFGKSILNDFVWYWTIIISFSVFCQRTRLLRWKNSRELHRRHQMFFFGTAKKRSRIWWYVQNLHHKFFHKNFPAK